MIEQLKSAGDQLRAALDNYYRVYLGVETYCVQINASRPYDFPPELTNLLDAELVFTSSYKLKIDHARIAISRARNYSSGVTPISILPSEILIRIFHLVIAQPCNIGLIAHKSQLSRYPDGLAQVCALWRRIALSSCSLWCHIDLPLHGGSICNAFVNRAWTHVYRAGELPIEVHVAKNEYRGVSELDEGNSDVYGLVSHISGRVHTLELVVGESDQSFQVSLLGQLLLSEQATVRRLVLSAGSGRQFGFVSAYGDPDSEPGRKDFQVYIDYDELERSFARLTVLHLRDIFPRWSSAAYHGLVDLRLLSAAEQAHIHVEKLIAILNSSPGLRILHFGLGFDDPTPVPEKLAPVDLQDLQVVKIFLGSTSCLPGVLSLLATGSKPLRLCIDGYYEPDAEITTAFESFFARSNVARFYTRNAFPPMGVLLRHSAHLEHVVLDHIISNPQYEPPCTWLQVDGLGSLPRLGSLHIRRSFLSEDDFQSLLECCPNGTVLYSCGIDRDDGDGGIILRGKELADAFPTARTVECMIHPSDDLMADWDILD